MTYGAFSKPTAEQIQSAMENPEEVGALVENASSEEAVDVLLSIIREIEQSDMEAEVKRDKVSALFAEVADTFDEDKAALVLSDVARRIRPELLPNVAAPGMGPVAGSDMPIALPLAPPVAPEYEGQ